MAPPGGHQGHGQISIDTYRLKVLNKAQVIYPESLGPILFCVNTWYYIIVHYKCCFHLKCLLYVRYFLNMVIPIYTSNSNAYFSQNIPGYQMSDFEPKKTKIFWRIL